MEKPLSLTLLYTANIAGDLALLPRLFTFLQGLQAAVDQPALLLDLGESCADDVWHCQETGGRSTLIVLDGMGYHVANVAGLLAREARDTLGEQVTLGLVDEEKAWLDQATPYSAASIRVALRPGDDRACLEVIPAPAATTRVEGRTVYLAGVCAGQVGEAVVDLRGEPTLAAARIHQMPPDTPPNPSIAATVEFVEAEARYFAKQAR